MRKQQKIHKRSLRVCSEMIRNLSSTQLVGVAGGSVNTTQSNNGCGGTGSGPTVCHACQF